MQIYNEAENTGRGLVETMQMAGMLQYEMGVRFFEENLYEKAVQCFISAYEEGVCQEEIIESIYNCFVLPNNEEFKKNYEMNNKGFSDLTYEELPIDFIFVSEGVFYLFDRENREFLGKFEMQDMQTDNKEAEFSSLLIADIWDIRQMLPKIQEKNWSNIYIVPGECEGRFMSFLKVPGFFEQYLKEVIIFSSDVIMERYFEMNREAYLPKTIFGVDGERYLKIIDKIHNQRIYGTEPLRKGVFLSICIPSYERGKEALSNVRHILQTEYDSEIEIIVSNNGSRHNCAGYEEIKNIKDSRLVYYEFEENQGYATNIRKLLGAASGKFAVFTSDEDTIILDNIGNYLTFLYNNSQTGVLNTEVCKIDYSYVGKAIRYKKGYDAVQAAYNLNYLTGITFHMEDVKKSNALKRFDDFRGNAFLEYYAHIAIALFTSENTDVIESKIALWKEGKEAEEELANVLLNYMKVESRMEQLNAAIDLFSKSMNWDKNVLTKMCIICMGKIYYLLNAVYLTRKEAFESEYRWEDVRNRIHLNNKRLIQEKMLWLGEDADRVEAIADRMYEDWRTPILSL